MGPSEYDVLQLGCGNDYRTEAWNVDVEPGVEPDEVVDLNDETWPWADNSFQVLIAQHVLEHLDDPLAALAEIQRVTVPGGTVIVAYPIGYTRFEDPTHSHYWNYSTAAWIGGNGEHMQENHLGLELMNRAVSVSCGGLTGVYVSLRRHYAGDGPWLSQVPGLSGEVEARYRVKA